MEIEEWPRRPEAAEWLEAKFAAFAKQNPLIAQMEAKFRDEAGVRVQSLADHWILPEDAAVREGIIALGFVPETLPEGDTLYRVAGARLAGVRFKANRVAPTLALIVEDIELLATQNGLTLSGLHGDADSAYQCGHVELPHGELMPITRNGYRGFAPGVITGEQREKLAVVRGLFQNRERSGDEHDVLETATSAVKQAIELIGQDRACDEFFLAEREYYMARNAASRWQYARQQEIGIGWANHDHHTYRSTRESFRSLIQLFKTLGFVIREKFYAGREAGWGAQVLEHPVSRVVIFADVDMAPEELNIEYSEQDLSPRDDLGTIGLWCAFHTSSIAEAGMHHIECEFDFTIADALHKAQTGGVMKPFTDLPMLKQAFTAAELWKVPEERLALPLALGAITQEQAEHFQKVGAPGSHLEILQRWEGFKGFNKTGVSSIIRETDARNVV